MQYTKYIAPPKLKSDFLLGGLTLTELLIGLGLLFLFFSVSVKMAFIVVGIWVVFNVRLYEGRSIRTYLGIIIRYHTTPQQYRRENATGGTRRICSLRLELWRRN